MSSNSSYILGGSFSRRESLGEGFLKGFRRVGGGKVFEGEIKLW